MPAPPITVQTPPLSTASVTSTFVTSVDPGFDTRIVPTALTPLIVPASWLTVTV
jgi:hypothetical protein